MPLAGCIHRLSLAETVILLSFPPNNLIVKGNR